VALSRETGAGLAFKIPEVLVEGPEERLDAVIGYRDRTYLLGRGGYPLV
jgi:hypothetical protein